MKLKNYATGPQKTSYKCRIEILKDDETRDKFQLIISNKLYQAFVDLQEKGQHLGEG